MRTLNLLVLRCRDLEQARTFYECFGMAFEKHAHGRGPEHYAHEDERGVFELYPVPTDGTADNTGLGFSAGCLEDVSTRLLAAGFAPEPSKQTPWGRTFVVRDPDRRRVEVKEVRPPVNG
jgi:catechol 2,3-dioxygenase-like lactoylglutathione lyase family enzyme